MATTKPEDSTSSTAAPVSGEVKKKTGTAARGFASMDPQRQREIASLGGKASHASGNAHEFTSEEARAAGSKSRSGKRTGSSDAATDNAASTTASVKPAKPAV